MLIPNRLPSWRDMPRWPTLLIFLWFAIMTALPILKWNGFAHWLPGVISVSVVAQSVAVVAILRLSWSWSEIGRTIAFVAVLTLLVEAVGTATGVPFGEYTYTERLQPKLLHVPLLIPFAWFMMLPASWAVAMRWRNSPLRFSAVAATAMTAWDLMLDPQMVGWGFWEWANPVGFFGIPWSNFLGWWITAFGLTLGLWWLFGRRQAGHPLARLPVRPLLVVYAITWFLESFGLSLFWGMPGPGMIGGAVMGLCLWVGWRGSIRLKRS